MPTLCNNPQCRGVLNERTPERCPECGIPTGASPRERININIDITADVTTDAEIKHAAQFSPGSVTPAAKVVTPPPTPSFTTDQMIAAINAWLQFGQDMFNDGYQDGYFSGDGWAVLALRAAREFIEHTTTKV